MSASGRETVGEGVSNDGVAAVNKRAAAGGLDAEGCVTLGPYVTAGRSAKNLIQVHHARASAMHAIVSWEEGCWYVRDLNSTNGLLVDGHRVDANAKVVLSEGSALCFGVPEESWQLLDAGPPRASARLADGTKVDGDLQFLSLPNDDHAECQLAHYPGRGWMAEFAERSAPIDDGARLALPSGVWSLQLPRWEERTDTTEVVNAEAGDARWALDSIQLLFHSSPNGEDVEVVVTNGERSETVKRGFNEVWELLAKERLSDGGMPDVRERGWVDKGQLVKDAGLGSVKKLNNHVCRLRATLQRMGVKGGFGIVERRPNSIRHGIERVTFG